MANSISLKQFMWQDIVKGSGSCRIDVSLSVAGLGIGKAHCTGKLVLKYLVVRRQPAHRLKSGRPAA